jgi:hypothetical protein
MKWKVSLEDEEILRKYRVQTRNSYVSSEVESFTCGAQTSLMDLDKIVNSKWLTKEVNFGIGKKELSISNRNFVNGYLGNVNGGS